MRRVLLTTLIVLVLCVIPLISAGAHVEGAEIVTYGIYGPEGKISPRDAADKNEQGTHWKLVEKTDRVPATRSTSFGIEFVVKGSPEGGKVKITLVYLHPTMTNPKTGRKFDTQEVNVSAFLGRKIHEGYTFDHDWELVTGAWIIEVYYEGRKLAERTFSVYKP